MKISIILSDDTVTSSKQSVETIVSAAKKKDIDVEVVDLATLDNLDQWIDSLGDVVIFRWASAVRNAKDRTFVFKEIASRKVLLNDIMINFQNIRWKDWQQEYMSKNTSLRTIPTWRFLTVQEWDTAVANELLPWPLIQKPRGGILGRDVHLLRSPSDLVDPQHLSRYVWQTFIPNNGDFRVLVVGGKVIGNFHRRAAEGKITNNIGQGGIGSVVNDPSLSSKINEIGAQIQKVIPLDIVGVDLIQHQDNHHFYFLELNVSPGWMEFEAVNKINVADHVIDLCLKRFNDRESDNRK